MGKLSSTVLRGGRAGNSPFPLGQIKPIKPIKPNNYPPNPCLPLAPQPVCRPPHTEPSLTVKNPAQLSYAASSRSVSQSGTPLAHEIHAFQPKLAPSLPVIGNP